MSGKQAAWRSRWNKTRSSVVSCCCQARMRFCLWASWVLRTVLPVWFSGRVGPDDALWLFSNFSSLFWVIICCLCVKLCVEISFQSDWIDVPYCWDVSWVSPSPRALHTDTLSAIRSSQRYGAFLHVVLCVFKSPRVFWRDVFYQVLSWVVSFMFPNYSHEVNAQFCPVQLVFWLSQSWLSCLFMAWPKPDLSFYDRTLFCVWILPGLISINRLLISLRVWLQCCCCCFSYEWFVYSSVQYFCLMLVFCGCLCFWLDSCLICFPAESRSFSMSYLCHFICSSCSFCLSFSLSLSFFSIPHSPSSCLTLLMRSTVTMATSSFECLTKAFAARLLFLSRFLSVSPSLFIHLSCLFLHRFFLHPVSLCKQEENRTAGLWV